MSDSEVDRSRAIELLRELVSIPSVSGEEQAASQWLAERMNELGYDRALVDEAGNAVGEIGDAAASTLVILLGHIDTVPGEIPVRIEGSEDGGKLFGRGSVDAKGALAAFTVAAARLGSAWARRGDLRLVVAGAVEEEAATSKGARFLRDRFDGRREAVPTACVVGEPSLWNRITLSYKGRILIELTAAQDVVHTAGPDPGVATVAVDFWNRLTSLAEGFNRQRLRSFDQLQTSLRHLETRSDDGLRETVCARIGIRLPPELDRQELIDDVLRWATERTGAAAGSPTASDREDTYELRGGRTTLSLRFYGYEPAWKSDSRNTLVRSFLEAIRHTGPTGTRPRFVAKTGTSDMNVVAPVWRCPILAYGPGDSALDHSPQEHLSLDEYWRSVLVLKRALDNLAEVL